MSALPSGNLPSAKEMALGRVQSLVPGVLALGVFLLESGDRLVGFERDAALANELVKMVSAAPGQLTLASQLERQLENAREDDVATTAPFLELLEFTPAGTRLVLAPPGPLAAVAILARNTPLGSAIYEIRWLLREFQSPRGAA